MGDPADPIVSNIPSSFSADQSAFLRSLKSSVEFLMGHGRNSDKTRALRVGELEKLGWDYHAFLKSSASSPYPTGGSSTSQKVPPAPSNLVVSKGVFVHTLTWDNPSDPDKLVSHVEIWVAANSQSRDDASLVAIVTVTDSLRGEQGIYKHAGFDVTHDMTYWIRNISFGGMHSPWCPPDTQGGYTVPGSESVNETISKVLDILNGQITENQLYVSLNSRINLIDEIGTGLVDRVTTVEEDVSSHASDVTTLQTTVGEHTTAIQTHASSINGIEGKYSVKIDSNGYVSGFGLISTANDGVPTSEFIILTDKFKIVTPGKNPVVPFSVGMVDGIPTVGIDGNAVIDGTLLGRSIQAGGITAGHLAANQVLVGHTIRSSNYISGYQGWMINGVAGTAEFNNMTLNITYNDILGSKPPIDADKTSQNVAYDTTHVNGSSASTVAYNAANGATFTSSSYLNSTQQNAITSIGGGWVTTSSVGSPSGVRFTFSPSGMVLSGGSGTGNCISLQNTSARVWGYNGVAGLSGTECRLQTLSSTIGYTGGSFYPYFNGTVALGTSVSQFADLYTGGLVVNFSRVYDVIDDLETLHSIEPDAAGVMNPQTLPDDFTSRGRLRSTLRNDLGELATDEEIEEMLNDPDDMGGKIGLDLGNFVALIEGALRQLDKENSAVQYEFLNWLGDMEQRLQAIEDAA